AHIDRHRRGRRERLRDRAMTPRTTSRSRSPRTIELVLLVFSIGISMAAYASVGLAHDGALPAGMLGYGGGLALLFRAAHVATRDVLALACRRIRGIDLPGGRDLGPVVVTWLASLAVLVLERDLGTSLLFFGVFVAMLYVATERLSWLLIGMTLFLFGSFLA